MLTLADTQNDWVGLFKVLTQPDFDPFVLEFLSNVKGWTKDSIPKRAFTDIVSVFIQSAADADADKPALRFYSVLSVAWPPLVGLHSKVSNGEFCRNFVSFVSHTPFCDRLLVRYRLTTPEKFTDFAENCLKSWSKTSPYRYERQYQ